MDNNITGLEIRKPAVAFNGEDGSALRVIRAAKRRLITILLALLAPCASLAQAADMPFSGLGLRIQRPATSRDGYYGGLHVFRDTTDVTGGLSGHVNAALFSRCIAGKNVVTFEWCNLNIVDNYAIAGENVASYSQGNKFGIGPTWGAVAEVADTVGAGGAAFGMEIDNWTTGPDNGSRFGLGIFVGDARHIRGLTTTPSTAEASYGLFIASSGNTPWARWKNGVVIKDASNAGIVLQGDSVRGLWLQGRNVVGLDLSGGETETAIRLKAGDRVTFDQYDQYAVHLDPGTQDLVFTNAGAVTMRLTPGGHLYITGQLHQGAR